MERGGGLPNTASDFGEFLDGSTIQGGDDLNGIVLQESQHHGGDSNSNNLVYHHQLQFIGGGDEESGGGEHEDEAMHPLSEFQFMEEVGEYGVEQSQPTTGDYNNGTGVVIKQEIIENGNCNGEFEEYSMNGISQTTEEEEDQVQNHEDDDMTMNKQRKSKKAKIQIRKDVEYFGRVNINTYLRARKYCEERKTWTKGEIAKCIRSDVSLLNVVLNGSNYETEDIFTEYDRFWKFYSWTKARNVCMSLELKPLLIPILAFFFRELYISRLLQQAFKLVTDFCKRLAIEEKTVKSRVVLMKLCEIQNPKEFNEDKVLNEIFTKEHRYVLSEWTFTHLRRFLSKPQKTVLVNLFSRFFIFELRNTQELIDSFIDNDNGEKKTESIVDTEGPEDEMEVLKEVKDLLARVSELDTEDESGVLKVLEDLEKTVSNLDSEESDDEKELLKVLKDTQNIISNFDAEESEDQSEVNEVLEDLQDRLASFDPENASGVLEALEDLQDDVSTLDPEDEKEVIQVLREARSEVSYLNTGKSEDESIKLNMLKNAQSILCSSDSGSEDEEHSEVFEVLKDLRGSVQANVPSVIVYTTNCQPISGAISPGATTLAFGMSDCGIRIFDTYSAKNLFASKSECDSLVKPPKCRTVKGHVGSVYGVDFHPRTKLLFSAGEDRTLRAWDFSDEIETPCRAVYKGHLGPIWSMSITNSGQLLATGSSDTTARIWVPERSDCVRVFVGHYYDVDAVTFHPNEAYLASGSVDKSVRFWSVSEGKVCRMMTGSTGRISAITFDQSGKYLIAGGEENKVRIWDIAQGTLVAQLPSLSHCKDLAIYRNMLAGCFNNGAVSLWNIREIIGGEESIEIDGESEIPNISIPQPEVIQCRTKSVFRLLYKDPSNLYCLGKDPSSNQKRVVIREWENLTNIKSNTVVVYTPPSAPALSIEPIQPLLPVPTEVAATDTNKFTIKIENPEEETQEQEELLTDPLASSSPINNSSSSPNNNSIKEETRDFIEETEGENTNNTITSSDMEFEVDEQMLQSLVDGTLL